MSSKKIYACLPFVELPKGEGIDFGLVHFWPSSEAAKFIEKPVLPDFQDYFETIRIIKAQKEKELITTTPLPLSALTCISIDDSINQELRETLLIDALYLLYFAISFRNMYYNAEVPKMKAFSKILPASEEFIQNKDIREKAFIAEAKREEVACITWVDEEICEALGKELQAIYSKDTDPKTRDDAIRLIRSIRFFVDRFFSKFENLLSSDIQLQDTLFEPEDTLFLASSFEVLLDINEKNPASDFRYKVRPMLHLKFSKPVELFWKWVDAFYLLKKQVIHGTIKPEDRFLDNPNFEVSLVHIGIKLFIYMTYYKLFKSKLIHASDDDSFAPPDFKWIHPQELLLYFWTEESLFRKISLLLIQMQKGNATPENESDLKLLTSLFVNFMERFYTQKELPFTRFLPSDEATLSPYYEAILNYGSDYGDHLAENFLLWIKKKRAF